MITNDETSVVFSENDCTLRTPESHERHCLLLEGPLQSHFSTLYGINRCSILDVPGFSLATCLPHDIMHDLFEGVARKELGLFLTYCTTQGFFTINQFNQRIEHYNFIVSKPSLIETTPQSNIFKIQQSADQMISLVRELPMLIGDKIPCDNKHYHCSYY